MRKKKHISLNELLDLLVIGGRALTDIVTECEIRLEEFPLGEYFNIEKANTIGLYVPDVKPKIYIRTDGVSQPLLKETAIHEALHHYFYKTYRQNHSEEEVRRTARLIYRLLYYDWNFIKIG